MHNTVTDFHNTINDIAYSDFDRLRSPKSLWVVLKMDVPDNNSETGNSFLYKSPERNETRASTTQLTLV